jgi:protein-S-isoprenylcysteine O-methyltransferase Ste14
MNLLVSIAAKKLLCGRVRAMQLRNEAVGEYVGKAVLIAAFGALTALKVMAIRSEWMTWEPSAGIEKYLSLAAHGTQLAFLFLVLGTTLLRFRPQRTAEGWEPRVSALAGTFLSMSLVAFPPVDLGPLWRIASILLALAGWSLSVWVLASLGRSFSITPQARRLVTTGPYSLVRHPLYVCEEIAFIGIAMMCISPGTIAIVIVQWLFQLRRMTNEERVLRSTFPEYAAYAAKTPKVIPRLRIGTPRADGVPIT